MNSYTYDHSPPLDTPWQQNLDLRETALVWLSYQAKISMPPSPAHYKRKDNGQSTKLHKYLMLYTQHQIHKPSPVKILTRSMACHEPTWKFWNHNTTSQVFIVSNTVIWFVINYVTILVLSDHSHCDVRHNGRWMEFTNIFYRTKLILCNHQSAKL